MFPPFDPLLRSAVQMFDAAWPLTDESVSFGESGFLCDADVAIIIGSKFSCFWFVSIAF